MTDISKCGNSDKCEVKEQCYRYIAPANEYSQSYSLFYKDNLKNPKDCEGYWKVVTL